MTVKIEHSDSGDQLATYLITQPNSNKYLAYEGDADYEGNTLKFHHIDGMYSYCTTLEDEVVHLPATSLVTVIRPLDEEDK